MKLVRTAILTTLTALLLSLSAPAWAQWGYPPQQPAASERDVQDVQHQLDLLKKNFERQGKQSRQSVTFQDKRITDFQFVVSIAIGILGIMIAVASFATFFTSRSKAKDQAAESAEQWMKEHAQEEVAKRMMAFDERLKDLENAAQRRINDLVQKISDAAQHENKQTITQNQIDELNEVVVDVEKRPEPERSFDDWYAIATAYFFEGEYIEAIRHLERAICAIDATDQNIAKALYNKGIALRKAGDTEASIVVYDTVIERYKNSADTALRQRVALALGNRGFARLTMAKKVWQDPEEEGEARTLLSMALTDIDQSLSELPEHPTQLGNRGYALYLMGNETDAEAALQQALVFGKEEARDVELADAKIHPLPQDEAFVALVNRLWAEVQATETDV